jgi:hypothetical protein
MASKRIQKELQVGVVTMASVWLAITEDGDLQADLLGAYLSSIRRGHVATNDKHFSIAGAGIHAALGHAGGSEGQ